MIVRKAIAAFTVNDLIKALTDIKENGMGDRLVIMPNADPDNNADYVSIGKIDCNDSMNTAIYLEPNYPEDERLINYDSLSTYPMINEDKDVYKAEEFDND